MLLKAIRNGLGQLIILGDAVSRPKSLERQPREQAAVDAELKNMSLYQFRACPFCVKVRRTLHRLNLPMELRDAANDTQHREALASGGGQVKVPCLRVNENGEERWLYESDAIIGYLDSRFGATT